MNADIFVDKFAFYPAQDRSELAAMARTRDSGRRFMGLALQSRADSFRAATTFGRRAARIVMRYYAAKALALARVAEVPPRSFTRP